MFNLTHSSYVQKKANEKVVMRINEKHIGTASNVGVKTGKLLIEYNMQRSNLFIQTLCMVHYD